jgi:hypothetical protein
MLYAGISDPLPVQGVNWAADAALIRASCTRAQREHLLHAGLKFRPTVSDITPMLHLPNSDRSKPRTRPGRVVRFTEAAKAAGTQTGRRSTLGPSTSSMRLDASPPSLRHSPNTAWQRLVFWLLAPAPQEAAPPLNRLPAVRDDFLEAVADVPGETAHGLRHRIVHAHSLRDLWHLRADVFSLVGLEHSQWEAERRLLRLNRHFPMRATRSQFGGL